MDKEYHVIFMSANGKDGQWQDYCRVEPKDHGVPDSLGAVEVWALKQSRELERREGCDFCYRLERW